MFLISGTAKYNSGLEISRTPDITQKEREKDWSDWKILIKVRRDTELMALVTPFITALQEDGNRMSMRRPGSVFNPN